MPFIQLHVRTNIHAKIPMQMALTVAKFHGAWSPTRLTHDTDNQLKSFKKL